jgi:hypothetical protein
VIIIDAALDPKKTNAAPTSIARLAATDKHFCHCEGSEEGAQVGLGVAEVGEAAALERRTAGSGCGGGGAAEAAATAARNAAAGHIDGAFYRSNRRAVRSPLFALIRSRESRPPLVGDGVHDDRLATGAFLK